MTDSDATPLPPAPIRPPTPTPMGQLSFPLVPVIPPVIPPIPLKPEPEEVKPYPVGERPYSRITFHENAARLTVSLLVMKGVAFNFLPYHQNQRKYQFTVARDKKDILNLVMDACLPHIVEEV